MKSLNTYLTEALEGSKMKYTGKHTQFADIIIENDKGEILILRRANYMKNFKTCWCIPGGNVDVKDKNTVDTVVRETMEETGIEIDMAQQLKLKPIFTYKFENGNVSDIYYIKLENTPDVKLSREHSKYEWVRFSDEKIDGRKWVPETFTILQKWEQKPLNERLIVNKNYNANTYANDISRMNWKYESDQWQTTWKLLGDVESLDIFKKWFEHNIISEIKPDANAALENVKNYDCVIGIGKERFNICRYDSGSYEGYHIFSEFGVTKQARIMYNKSNKPDGFELLDNKWGWWKVSKNIKCYIVEDKLFEELNTLYKKLIRR